MYPVEPTVIFPLTVSLSIIFEPDQPIPTLPSVFTWILAVPFVLISRSPPEPCVPIIAFPVSQVNTPMLAVGPHLKTPSFEKVNLFPSLYLNVAISPVFAILLTSNPEVAVITLKLSSVERIP